MSLKSVKNVEKNLASLEILIPREDFDAAVKKAYHKNVGKINVPGFRKGKAPQGIIEKMYGKTVFYDDAIDDVFPAVYTAAVEEADLDVVSRPEIELGSDDENGVVIVTRVYLKPEVKVGNYKGYELTKKAVAVTDADIDTEIEMVRKRNSRVITIEDRPLANGDTAKFDFEGFVDGVAFDGGKAEDYSLVIGSGQFIPGFEEQMVGHSVGEEFDVNVTFPEDYGAENLKGKAAVFKIKLKGITMTELPELDDEFAKDVSEYNTLAEYRDSVKAKITERKEKAADADFEEKVQDELLKNVEIDVPQCMIDDETEQYIRDYDRRLRMQGGSVELYLQYMGMTLEQLKENFSKRAERAVRLRLALEKIAELENVTVTDEQVEEEYKAVAASYNIDADTVKKSVSRDMIEPDIKLRNTVKLIKDSAVVTVSAEEPATESAES